MGTVSAPPPEILKKFKNNTFQQNLYSLWLMYPREDKYNFIRVTATTVVIIVNWSFSRFTWRMR